MTSRCIFHIGEPLSLVELAAKRTGRKEIRKRQQGLEVNKINKREHWPMFKIFYHDWTLTLKQRREDDGSGLLLYRVTEIVETEEEGDSGRVPESGT